MSQIAFPTTKPGALFPILSSFNPQKKLLNLYFCEILPNLNSTKKANKHQRVPSFPHVVVSVWRQKQFQMLSLVKFDFYFNFNFIPEIV